VLLDLLVEEVKRCEFESAITPDGTVACARTVVHHQAVLFHRAESREYLTCIKIIILFYT
jgi:hypothetical protein